ncbi:hypothetical protein J1605_006138 [Eschrichtius robustus]|uniref:Uncharacterized protein n=1 Tax=Eschrichtius robustus TaxID=9764 RepID=A0AB34H7G6_ESCRO|nr:hypothetical protein J1605_006138 [Eschrichtius robustus]
MGMWERLAGSTKAVSPALSIQAESIHHHGQKQLLPQPEPEQTPPPETKMSQPEEAVLPEAQESVLPPLHHVAMTPILDFNGSPKYSERGLPWWCSGCESACQCRGHGFDPWSGKIPHAGATKLVGHSY